MQFPSKLREYRVMLRLCFSQRIFGLTTQGISLETTLQGPRMMSLEGKNPTTALCRFLIR